MGQRLCNFRSEASRPLLSEDEAGPPVQHAGISSSILNDVLPKTAEEETTEMLLEESGADADYASWIKVLEEEMTATIKLDSINAESNIEHLRKRVEQLKKRQAQEHITRRIILSDPTQRELRNRLRKLHASDMAYRPDFIARVDMGPDELAERLANLRQEKTEKKEQE
jgi:deoxyadenosine/deoxycytidine kinase